MAKSSQLRDLTREPGRFGAGAEGETASVPEVLARAAVPESTSTQPSPPAKKRYRVSLPGLRVLVQTQDKGGVLMPYLDLEAVDEADALEQFATYNGIQWTTENATGRRKLASQHAASIELMPG